MINCLFRSQANWLSDVGVTIYSKFLQEFIEDVKVGSFAGSLGSSVGFFADGPSPSVSVFSRFISLRLAASLIKLA